MYQLDQREYFRRKFQLSFESLEYVNDKNYIIITIYVMLKMSYYQPTENFRNACVNNYNFNSVNYLIYPLLACDTRLKLTEINHEFIDDLPTEKGIKCFKIKYTA